MVTEPTENLLAAIYRLTCEAPYASSGASYACTKDIAISLGVSQPTVSEKIVRLAEEGYLDHKWRKGVALTEKGRLMALGVLRRHRLIETFLVKVLEYSIDEVNEEACRLEHAVSDRLADAMDAMLGYPRVDPHGHPIPTKEGIVALADYQALADALPGQTVLVKQVNDRDKERLKYLKELGIVPGARISVLDAAPFGGPLSLDIDGKAAVIANGMARKVGVTSAEQKNLSR
jgi:DtxR family Mn-dependent transcriptional regulator